ncbi:hypothetical protein NW754_002591 [Fusarium falciforme]|nr:hypothetical protein NW754_002591 [Fusarium falciforme]
MSRYAAAHANPQGPGDARPTALQIIKDEGMEGKLNGKVIVVTGTSSGIGIETVRALSTTGAKFFLTARNLSKAKTALKGVFDPERMELVEMDQCSLESVRTAASQILAKTDKINILINNAGVMAIQNLEFTKDGHETQFGTNHLSHFLFFELLKPALLAATTPEFNSRVTTTTTKRADTLRGGAYAQSKTANVYMASELERRYGAQGLHATSVHPGGIMTGLSQHIPDSELEAFKDDEKLMKQLKSPEQGAATTVWAAIGKEWEGKGGRYLEDCREAEPSKDEKPPGSSGYVEHTYDPEREGRLWEDSLKLVRLA